MNCINDLSKIYFKNVSRYYSNSVDDTLGYNCGNFAVLKQKQKIKDFIKSACFGFSIELQSWTAQIYILTICFEQGIKRKNNFAFW